MRLIDADKFLKEILTARIGKTIIEYSESDIGYMIRRQPTVDVAEVLRDQWISAKDRMPEAAETVNKDSQDEFSLSNSVLAFGNNGFAIAMVERDENHEIFVDMDGNYISEVTHWMPLPDPPEEDK